nr:unnamed protein product [Callosobruchus analis]
MSLRKLPNTFRSFKYLGPRSYNLIPSELKTINSIELFKKRCKQWVMNLPRSKAHEVVNIKQIRN